MVWFLRPPDGSNLMICERILKKNKYFVQYIKKTRNIILNKTWYVTKYRFFTDFLYMGIYVFRMSTIILTQCIHMLFGVITLVNVNILSFYNWLIMFYSLNIQLELPNVKIRSPCEKSILFNSWSNCDPHMSVRDILTPTQCFHIFFEVITLINVNIFINL